MKGCLEVLQSLVLTFTYILTIQEFLFKSSFCCVDKIEAEEKKLREASLAASSRLKRALLKEKETKDSLQKALNEVQVCITLLSCQYIKKNVEVLQQ